MMRYFYCLCFLIGGMGLPLSAMNTATDSLTPSSSGKGTKGVPIAPVCPPASAVAQAKEQNNQKSVATITSDLSRFAAASLAKKDQVSAPLPKQTAQAEHHPDKKAAPAKTPFLVIAPRGLPPRSDLVPAQAPAVAKSGRLARVTAYWAAEGDYYTERCISATGVRLHDGHCAVDPNIIPYGSVVEIAGVGKFLAVDTGSAVISRTAAKEGGHTSAERNALVIDVFFENRKEGEKFAALASKFVSVSWWTPASLGVEAKAARSLFAEEDWTRIQGKQL
jgi:3D (Asp-Asp-Asp) domain-containing protein